MTVVSASIPPSEVSLGGIQAGATPQYVWNYYGKPEDIIQYHEDSMIVTSYFYGASHVKFHDNEAVNIGVNLNNGWATPAGIRVGIAKEDVIRLYGQPDFIADPHPSVGHLTKYYYYDSSNRFNKLILAFDDNKVRLMEIDWE